ncbi:hypothetical protein [Leptospira licerasiae]|uniref:Lipoprotein n=1 Tax=Leptospira licerasiae str. MMD4847 TaxID=1049971 RepID=A0ABP2R9T8_9LEPT|nr:hypothetical protein [Leptospira licerasiae]EIE00759.1 hypothetical protein LEP1GSC185_0277 [Leptospira licerasiae serovar Varillal str. VAR 010]EJZ41311.1 hypothetical protein LEP1GSC178_1867 [Leptospira licerasiae str. MMD4847]
MLKKLPIPILSLFLFFQCSGEDIDELKGKKKEKSNPVVSYSFCVAQTQSCIDADGADCFIVRDNPRYFDAGGGGVEKFCFDNLVETYIVTETGGM